MRSSIPPSVPPAVQVLSKDCMNNVQLFADAGVAPVIIGLMAENEKNAKKNITLLDSAVFCLASLCALAQIQEQIVMTPQGTELLCQAMETYACDDVQMARALSLTMCRLAESFPRHALAHLVR
jgi:hypothetical protein